jgi:sortase A
VLVVRVVRGAGWTLVAAGAVVLLYVVYLLWFTGLETAAAQRDLGDRFERLAVDPPTAPSPSEPDTGSDTEPGTEPDATPAPTPASAPLEAGEAFAALWFERDGDRIVNDEVLYIVEGTTVADLKTGPGHYPDSGEAGGDGNLGIAGHRTTYGAPFWSLEELTDGDTIHVVDREGVEWVYAYREQRIVQPSDVWVVEDVDPIDLDAPTITLTTCHPRTSAAQRLIAWGELVGPAEGNAGADDTAGSEADDTADADTVDAGLAGRQRPGG